MKHGKSFCLISLKCSLCINNPVDELCTQHEFPHMQLRGDLIQTYRIVRGRECTLHFDEFFELAGTDRLRNHHFKQQRKLAHSDVRRNAFSHRVIGAWNGLPDAMVTKSQRPTQLEMAAKTASSESTDRLSFRNKVSTVSAGRRTKSLANSLIQYVYTGQLEVTQTNAMAVVMFAKMMKLSDLENWGVQFMANRVNFENLATTWDFAKSMRMGSLMKTCINLMQEQFMNFVSTDLFLRLPADTVLTLLRNDNLSVDSEEAVFEAISSWVRAGDKECDNQRLRLHAPEMLKEVRWCQTTVQFRSRLLNSHPMFRDSTSCARFLGLVEQWMTYADRNKPPCPFNRRRRPPPTIFFVFGKGEDQDRWSVLRFDPQLQKEERVSDMEKREYATYSPVGESIFVVGGDTAQQEDSTSVEEFLVAERRWRKRASLAVGRIWHAAAVLTEAGGEALIGVFGGYNGRCLSTCEVYEVSRDRWFKLPDLREKRSATAAACLPGDSRIFVFGGWNGSSRLASVEFCQLRADWRERATSSDFWQPAAPMRTARDELAATHFRGKIIVAGGYVGGNRVNMVEMFTPPDASCPQGQWTELAGMKEPRAYFALLTSTDDAIFALGCWKGSGNTVETFTAPGGSADVSNDLTAWSWSSKKPLETLAKIAGAASIRM
ncbi:Kelch-like protein 12 [Sparganum proliferum]